MNAETVIIWVTVLVFFGIGLAVIYALFKCKERLCEFLLETGERDPGTGEREHKGSLSRLQLIIFTFIIAGLLLTLSLEAGAFVTIPDNLLYLLGISVGGYGLGKGVK